MHRISSIPGKIDSGELVLVEQPSAPVLFLSSAATDISTLAAALTEKTNEKWHELIRALPLSCLEHQSQIDHYFATTVSEASLIVVRLLGGRGHWNYGLEQLVAWQSTCANRTLIVISGIKDNEIELHSLSSIDSNYVDKLGVLFREGGINNITKSLDLFWQIANGQDYKKYDLSVIKHNDPEKWDWRNEKGINIGIIHYRSSMMAGDLKLAKRLNKSLRDKSYSPKTLFISTLRDKNVQLDVYDIFSKVDTKVILTTTSFASTTFEEIEYGDNTWDKLNVPILQLLCCTNEKDQWIKSSVGLTPLDLSLQVVLPEIDGRITTRPITFKSAKYLDSSLGTIVYENVPYADGLKWLISHVRYWINLQIERNSNKHICITLANYPIRDGRIANGVGLDTPQSTVELLKILAKEGYYLGTSNLPSNGNELINMLLSSRTNSPESFSNNALSYLSLKSYMEYWNKLPSIVKDIVIDRWGKPEEGDELEEKGFPVTGIKFGNVVILIQPSRGYDGNNLSDLHSPDLPPPHRYIAQYFWIKHIYNAHAIINLGKHGSLEWLPGKGVGLSNYCFPEVVLGSVPNIYPFIVNDPGEGTQAKRRSQAVIIDHLTPPLGRAFLHGSQLSIESLMDEYFEASLMNSKRIVNIEKQLFDLLKKESWPGSERFTSGNYKSEEIYEYFNEVDSYLCELKESQIRTGLHILCKDPNQDSLIELLLSIVRSPSDSYIGLTQKLARTINLNFDPWSDLEGSRLVENDVIILSKYMNKKPRTVGDAVDWLEIQAEQLLRKLLLNFDSSKCSSSDTLIDIYSELIEELEQDELLTYIKNDLWPRLRKCAYFEKFSIINAISGLRVSSGPSGAPSRGRPEVLPTGRNFYSVDLRGLPTEAAWDLGRRSAERVVDLHLMENGEPLKHLAMSVWGTATMRNGGEDISQLLALMGVKPVWDGPTRRIIDLEIIPLNQLQRNRVDVTLRISGLFRDAFPNLVSLVYKAQELIGSLDEDYNFNPLAGLRRTKGKQERIFGSAPGSYGAGLQAIIDSGSWETRTDLAKAYIAWSKWSYRTSNDVNENQNGLEKALSNVQVVLHSQDNREHDLLDSDDYYQFQGGLVSSVEMYSGKLPSIYFADHSRRERPRVHTLAREIDKVVRSRLLNPRWIEGMKKHGYKGCFEIGASLDYLFAYDASTNSVPNWTYSHLYESWINSSDIKNHILQNNPWVLRDIAERFLEASNRGLWEDASDQQLDNLRSVVNSAESRIESRESNN